MVLCKYFFGWFLVVQRRVYWADCDFNRCFCVVFCWWLRGVLWSHRGALRPRFLASKFFLFFEIYFLLPVDTFPRVTNPQSDSLCPHAF